MNQTEHSTGVAEGQTSVETCDRGGNRLGSLVFTDPVYAVSNLSSLFTVCALALGGADDYREDIKDRAIEDIKLTLEWGALLADDVALQVARAGGAV